MPSQAEKDFLDEWEAAINDLLGPIDESENELVESPIIGRHGPIKHKPVFSEKNPVLLRNRIDDLLECRSMGRLILRLAKKRNIERVNAYIETLDDLPRGTIDRLTQAVVDYLFSIEAAGREGICKTASVSAPEAPAGKPWLPPDLGLTQTRSFIELLEKYPEGLHVDQLNEKFHRIPELSDTKPHELFKRKNRWHTHLDLWVERKKRFYRLRRQAEVALKRPPVFRP